MEARNIIVRIITAIGWLLIIYFISNIIIGAIVGAIAGSATDSYEAGYEVGANASILFFQQYGLFVVIGQIVLFSTLAYLGMLPGTTKYKNAKNS